ncbi:hypothetical protein ABZ540_35835 [Nocardia xishanensis]|uniref:hypothetical protein n=1 Tax=Nocardia xishanensis TaxID=238964 RepID=UPI0033D3E54C
MPREVPGGIVRRWYCDNYRCPYPFHETMWCPHQMSTEVVDVPLPADQQQAVWELRAERARRAAADAERARPARRDPGVGWLVVILVGVLVVVVMLGVMGAR